MRTITLFFDGACEPRNPGGTGTWGFVIKGLGDPEEDLHIVQDCGALAASPAMTNNYAEYTALGKGLAFLASTNGLLQPSDELVIHGDSKLVVMQLGGLWACNAPRLIRLRERCLELLGKLPCKWRAEWIRRELNEEADALSQKAYVEATGKPFPVRARRK